jgi:hypothetical protein
MSKAPAPISSLPAARRLFEPARYSQHYLACAYLQLVPLPRRRAAAQAAAARGGATAAARPAAS